MEVGEELPMGIYPHHNSSHRALTVRIRGSRGLKSCARERETFSAQPPKTRKRSEGEGMFHKLVSDIDKPPKRDWW